jgi:hypothetical protein
MEYLHSFSPSSRCRGHGRVLSPGVWSELFSCLLTLLFLIPHRSMSSPYLLFSVPESQTISIPATVDPAPIVAPTEPCRVLLPGMDCYEGSSSDESDSEEEGQPVSNQYDLLGRPRQCPSSDGKKKQQ